MNPGIHSTTSKYYYIKFHKPYGVLSQFTKDHPGQCTLSDYLNLPKDVYPIGRLDSDSEGLLLLTNDNRFKNYILSPAHTIKKYYHVQVEGIPSTHALALLLNGVTINIRGHRHLVKATDVRKLEPSHCYLDRIPPIRVRKTIPDSWLEIIITEGKNRQVRKMLAAIGFPVLRLIRVQIGDILLGSLALGMAEELSINQFKYRK